MKRCVLMLIVLVMVGPVLAQDKAPPPPPHEVKLLHVKFTVVNEKSEKTQIWLAKGERPSVQLSTKNTLTVLEINRRPEGTSLIVQWDRPDDNWTRFLLPDGQTVQLCGSECYRVKVEEVKD